MSLMFVCLLISGLLMIYVVLPFAYWAEERINDCRRRQDKR